MAAIDIFKQQALGLKLTQISLRELSFLTLAPCDIFSFQSGDFSVVIPQKSEINRQAIKNYILKGFVRFFVTYENRLFLKNAQQENLRKVIRGLSMGTIEVNAKKASNLLCLNLSYLYEDPTDDGALLLQYQSVKNLGQFLMAHQKLGPVLYNHILDQAFHYTLSQPFLSSILLLSFLKQTYHFSEKEIENLFIASYFKDIGMSSLPDETYDKNELSLEERKALKEHAKYSKSILQGRVPLGPTYLQIIENHHLGDTAYLENSDELIGVETVMTNAMDTISAMTTKRPYRDPFGTFETLDHVRAQMGDLHPQEFKFMVSFLQNFFSKL